MIEAETALLVGVQKRLADALELEPNLVQIELDDEAPAVTGDLYYAISATGITPGPTHNPSGTTWDLLFGVRVAVMLRIGNVPRDRRRQVFLERRRGINAHLTRVANLVDFDYGILEAANEYLVNPETDSGIPPGTATEGQFLEPLRIASVDAKPRTIDRTAYDAAAQTVQAGFQPPAGDPNVAMIRGVNFGRARYMRERYDQQETT